MKYKKEYIINKDLCENGIITYKNIFELLMQTSNAHSEWAHATTEELQEKGLTWMIYKWRADFFKMPKVGENITVYTWASDFKRLNACREFEIYNEKNEKIVMASSVFLVIDLDKRKPIRIPQTLAEKFTVEKNKNFSKIERIKEDGNLIKNLSIDIKPENIDINRHVNNLVYIKWITENLPYDLVRNREIKSFNLIYSKEILKDDEVTLKYYKNDGNIYSKLATEETNAKCNIILK